MPAGSSDPMVGVGGERPLAARWVVCGRLTADGPLHLGGPGETTVDAPILRDRVDGLPLLTGASLAGALRSHLADVVAGYRRSEPEEVATLFGGARGDDEGAQSPLIVFDSLGRLPSGKRPEIRDGVAIDPATGTAEEHKKFDVEVLPAGTSFDVRFDLLVPDGAEESCLLGLLLATLGGLEAGEVRLGARTSRGYGRCRAGGWVARRFDLAARAGWTAWLATDPGDPLDTMGEAEGAKAGGQGLRQAVEAAWPGAAGATNVADQQRRFRAVLDLEWPRGGLLVRSPGTDPGDADATQLHSAGDPVLPGTSLAGALRARALRIARTVLGDGGDDRVEALFGARLRGKDGGQDAAPSGADELSGSRLTVSEGRLDGELLQGVRIRIDRFTGGVVDGALFDEEPLYGGKGSVTVEIRAPEPGDAGLLLLLVKDLLTGDLPVGGSASVGRGVTAGTAQLEWLDGAKPSRSLRWDPAAEVTEEEAKLLNGEVEALHRLREVSR